jgi:hypothetical protein
LLTFGVFGFRGFVREWLGARCSVEVEGIAVNGFTRLRGRRLLSFDGIQLLGWG